VYHYGAAALNSTKNALHTSLLLKNHTYSFSRIHPQEGALRTASGGYLGGRIENRRTQKRTGENRKGYAWR
jgi:hypothetical protein